MRAVHHSKKIASIFAVATLFAASPAALADEETTVDGEWSIIDGDVASAKDKAIEVALRRAVEQVAGTMVASETLVEDFQVKMDRIATQSKGFVKKYELVDQKKEDNVYTVKVKAVVTEGKLEDEMIKNGIILSRLGKPRIMLLVSEQNVGQTAASISVGQSMASTDIRICENTLINKLKPLGFDVIDAQAISGKVSSADAQGIITGGNAAKIREIADLTEAEIIVAGSCIAKDLGPIAGTRMRSSRANINVRVFNTDDGSVLATELGQAAGPHVDAVTGGTNALKKATEDMTDKLVKKLLAEWQRYVFGTRTFSMEVVGGASHKKVAALKSYLQYKVRGVQGVNVRKAQYRKGKANLAITVKGTPMMIADEIAAKPADGVSVEIVELSANKLSVELK